MSSICVEGIKVNLKKLQKLIRGFRFDLPTTPRALQGDTIFSFLSESLRILWILSWLWEKFRRCNPCKNIAVCLSNKSTTPR
jgi:hypothetical protein